MADEPLLTMPHELVALNLDHDGRTYPGAAGRSTLDEFHAQRHYLGVEADPAAAVDDAFGRNV